MTANLPSIEKKQRLQNKGVKGLGTLSNQEPENRRPAPASWQRIAHKKVVIAKQMPGPTPPARGLTGFSSVNTLPNDDCHKVAFIPKRPVVQA